MLDAPSYADRFATIHFERRDGILQMTLAHRRRFAALGRRAVVDLQEAFGTVAADTENRVVILTGTGDEFNGPKGSPGDIPDRRPPAAGSSRTGTCASC